MKHTQKALVFCLFALTQLEIGSCYECSLPGECESDNVLSISFPPDELTCMQSCVDEPACTWWNYDPDEQICTLLATCDQINTANCPQCTTGEGQCYYDQVNVLFVAGGHDGEHGLFSVELISLDDDRLDCPAIPDLDYYNYGGFGFISENRPVMCAFLNRFDRCMIFDTDSWTWKDFARLHQDRDWAAGAQLGDQGYIILGGYGSGHFLDTSEIYSEVNQTWSYSVDLPYLAESQCVVGLDNSSLLMTGGFVGLTMAQVSSLDLNTGTWTAMEPMKHQRALHSCGLVRPDDGGDPFVVVVGGYEGDDGLSSTELFVAGSWVEGVEFFEPEISRAGTAAFGDSFLLVGGKVGFDLYSKRIWQYNPAVIAAPQPWILRPEELSVQRYQHPVALVLKASAFNCSRNQTLHS